MKNLPHSAEEIRRVKQALRKAVADKDMQRANDLENEITQMLADNIQAANES